ADFVGSGGLCAILPCDDDIAAVKLPRDSSPIPDARLSCGLSDPLTKNLQTSFPRTIVKWLHGDCCRIEQTVGNSSRHASQQIGQDERCKHQPSCDLNRITIKMITNWIEHGKNVGD